MESLLQVKYAEHAYEGRVTYEEGDVIEVVFSETHAIPVGAALACTLLRMEDQRENFQGVVLARDDHRLVLFYSPTAQEFREQRRRYPRIPVDVKGWIRPENMEITSTIHVDPSVQVINISLGGLAFRYAKALEVGTKLGFYTELYGRHREDEAVLAKLEVTHVQEESGSYVYGCKITELSAKDLRIIRKYLLERQLEQLAERAKS